MRPTTTAENRKYLAKAAAWTYLVASCTDKAYALIERCGGDPYKAWSILQEKYCATDAEENYPELDQAFSDCKLVGTKKDPELWFNDLDHLNMRLARINLKYEKDDLQMKSHIMTAMSKDYDSVIVKFRGDLSDTPLAKLRKEVVLQFKTLVKDGCGRGSESVLSSSNTFKGTCRNCGKIGHKAHECRSAKVESTEGPTKEASTVDDVDKSNVTCYNCQGKGHYANECASAKNFKSDPTADMAMFVGASCVGTMPVYKGYDYCADVGDSFFDNMSDSVAFGEHEDTLFGHLIPACGSGGRTKNDTKTARIEDIAAETEPSAIEVELVEEQESKCDLDVLATDMNTPIMATNETTDEYDNVIVIPSAFVGSAVTLGLAEEMLFNDSGANGGVAYDNKHTTNSTDSNREVTIGNSGKFAALGDDAIKLKDLPDDNVPLDVPGHVSIAEDIPITMVVTGAATLETGVAPMESFSKILKSLGLFQCKTDPCLFYLFDRYGNLEAMVVAFCDDCIATTGREWWVTRLKIGILYDPQNTEDVKIYSATVPYNGNGTVVSACPCSDYDATVDVCSAYHTFDDGWITVYTKKKKEGDPLGNKGMSQGPRKVKDSTRIHGIEPVKDEIYGTGVVPVGFTATSIPPGVPRMRREQRPDQ
ncbi:hypothetical protein MHU86_7973 [Fragilaria crotonensis]|nr:hypothetical protein MHU86_7973 [Fragilaria crotonensis]